MPVAIHFNHCPPYFFPFINIGMIYPNFFPLHFMLYSVFHQSEIDVNQLLFKKMNRPIRRHQET